MAVINYEGLINHLAQKKGSFGLLTMQATSTTGRLMKCFPDRLDRLFSAEHGFFGMASPGERTASAWHPFWNRPIHSLYGEFRKPTDEMLRGMDRMVIDLCDIGVRCYTYLATIKNTLEACAARGIPVTVLDRQVPLGGILDGPMRSPSYSSFVAPLNVPLCHGMTPGECATWIARAEGLDLELNVIRLHEWSHADRAPWPNFVPPSPAISSWDSAVLYPMTVFTEAYPAVDCDRGGPLSFRIIGAPWMDQRRLIDELTPGLASCGVNMRPYRYVPGRGSYAGQNLNGILFSVGNPDAFYPVTAGALVLATILHRHGQMAAFGARPEWLDRLMGTSAVRETVCSREGLDAMFQSWIDGQDAFLASRTDLYVGSPAPAAGA